MRFIIPRSPFLTHDSLPNGHCPVSLIYISLVLVTSYSIPHYRINPSTMSEKITTHYQLQHHVLPNTAQLRNIYIVAYDFVQHFYLTELHHQMEKKVMLSNTTVPIIRYNPLSDVGNSCYHQYNTAPYKMHHCQNTTHT